MSKNYSNGEVMKRVLKEVKPFWLHILVMFLISLLTTLVALMKPLGLKMVIDNAFGNQPMPSFFSMAVSIGVQFLFFHHCNICRQPCHCSGPGRKPAFTGYMDPGNTCGRKNGSQLQVPTGQQNVALHLSPGQKLLRSLMN